MLPLAPEMLANLNELGYTQMTPIQAESLPPALAGRDLIAQAKTGSGKTAAFGIAALTHLQPKLFAVQLLVLCPTRELAEQVAQELRRLARALGNIKILSLCGGAPIGPQIGSLEHGAHIVVGTPGRVLKHLQKKTLQLDRLKILVLDEADRMLDMGFIHDMRFLLAQMPRERHTLFFSATISKEIEGLISEFLSDPVRISVKTGQTPKNIEQDIVRIRNGEKFTTLQELLRGGEYHKVLVFGRTKHGVEKLSQMLEKGGIKAKSIHGNKSQSQRAQALAMFKNDLVHVLVATDVAARGLDIPDVSHVINYDLPATYDDYVHRIGRTGRGNKHGKALTFIE